MRKLILPAPAKLNLFLHINAQQENGYHKLQTIFQLIDYCDTLTFSSRKDHEILINARIPDVCEKNNLVMRAAKAMQQYDKKRRGVEIGIVNCIPPDSGLGSDSSHAATTMLALNHLWSLKLPLQQLLSLGLQIGGDIPVFIYGKSCWAENLGEQISPLELPTPWFVVIVPPLSVSSAEIFFDTQLARNSPEVEISLSLLETRENNCQEVTMRRYPKVAETFHWLNQFNAAQMTGTGGAVFTDFDSHTKANQVLKQLPNDLTGFVARGLNISPLLTTLKIDR